MAVSRGAFAGAALVILGAAVTGIAVTALVFRADGRKSPAAVGPRPAAAGPRAVVDKSTYDAGIVESTAQMEHTFVIRNEGQAPLLLARGPSSCSCTTIKLPKGPIPPGERAEVTMGISDSAKKDDLKQGPSSRNIHVLTNDPGHPDLELTIAVTIKRRVTVAPSPLTLAIDSSKSSPHEERSVEACVYSERWDAFDLSVAKTSRPQLQCRIEPATAAKLKELGARHGYRVVATLPPDMAEGRFAEWIEFAVREKRDNTVRNHGAGSSPEPVPGTTTCRLEIQGRVSGRLTFYSPKLVDRNVLQLGTRPQGERIHETLVMKLSDKRRRLTAERIETEPAFLHARLAPYAGGPNDAGLYRLEVEIPGDAPSCAYTGEHRAVVRLRTDHPRLRVIELQVDFVLAAGDEGPGHVAAR